MKRDSSTSFVRLGTVQKSIFWPIHQKNVYQVYLTVKLTFPFAYLVLNQSEAKSKELYSA